MEHLANRVVVDTDALVGLLRSDPAWRKRIESAQRRAQLATTDINAFELYLGAHLSKQQDANAAAVKGLLASFPVLHTSDAAMETAARLAAELQRRGETIEVKDLLIAAIALVNGAAVLTGNERHFARIPALRLTPVDDGGTLG